MNASRWICGTSVVALALLVPTSGHAQEPWSYHDPGDLVPDSGTGLEDWTVYAPGMRFPIENGPAFPNSQVYNPGGYLGPPGGQCDAVNYDYPWRDNYCETRSWNMPLCPAGTGHQGQDIRPATCEQSVHWTVAAEDGTITNIGSYSVYLTTADGTRHDYLHGDGNAVSSGQGLAMGDPINRVSNEFGGTATTIHLHYNIRQDVAGLGMVYVSPYMSLVESYETLMGFGNVAPGGTVDGTTCEAIEGFAWDPDAPDLPVSVRVSFEGPMGDPLATVVEVVADQTYTPACAVAGSCEHGFSVEIPRSLRDGQAHQAWVYALDTEDGGAAELDSSPRTYSCAPPPVPAGVRRALVGADPVGTWNFSLLWDLAVLEQAALDAIEVGLELPEAPILVVADDGSDARWSIDSGYRREVTSASVALAWGMDWDNPLIWPASSVSGVPEGPAVRPEPFLVRGPGPELYVMDEPLCALSDPECGGGGDDDGGEAGTDDAEDGGTAGDEGDEGDGGGTASTASDEGGNAQGGDGGCACAVAQDADEWSRASPWLLGLWLWGARRRRRRRA